MKNFGHIYTSLAVFVLLTGSLTAQTAVRGFVKDLEKRAPLPYCSIRIQGTNRGTIANSDGGFSLAADLEKDTLIFSFVGYEQLAVPVSRFQKNQVVFLKQKAEMLASVSVYADPKYLYWVIGKCRKNLENQQGNRVAKTYFGLETHIGNQPAELIECYYNAYLRGISVEELRMKNGRIGLAVVSSRLFNSWETSKAMRLLNLVEGNSLFPLNPLQCSTKELERGFVLTHGSGDSTLLHILFGPRDNRTPCFNGEMWIDKSSFALMKIHLWVDSTLKYPFESVWDDSIRNVSMDITQQFKTIGKSVVPDYLRFQYRLNYETASSMVRLVTDRLPDMARDIQTSCMLYFYDYQTPFFEPVFEYDPEHSDYKKLAMLPYNEVFWEQNNAMLLTEAQITTLGFYAEKGFLINFRQGNYGKDFLSAFKNDQNSYNFPYTFWHGDRRIYLDPGMPQNKTWPPAKANKEIPSDLLHFEVQILLDVNPVSDTLHVVSYTVFDETATFFHLPFHEYTSVFSNLFFDICEIERRKMDQAIHALPHPGLKEIEAEYRQAKERIEATTQHYMREVQLGKNLKALETWNAYVFEWLGVDNLTIFNLRR